MPLTIGTNIASLQAQRRLNETGNNLSVSYQKLSSGLRINSASDDPAGLAIAQSLNSDRRIFTQGVRNFNDGISALNIAESALSELTNVVTRIRELAQQAANGGYSLTQRNALDIEAQALSDEYFRIVKTTKFNGLNLFDGSTQSILLQGGSGVDGGISTNVGGAIGTGTLATRVTVSNSNAMAVALSDLNNDGIIDMAVGGGDLRIKFGVGDGTFTQVQTINLGGSVGAHVNNSDLNNDGFMDLVIADSSNDSIQIFLNSGSGSFTLARTYASGPGTSRVEAADFNNDGYADLSVSGGAGVQVLLGQGNGTFASATTYTAGGSVSTTVADINNDGILDLLSAESSGRVSTWLGLGNGTFSTRISYLFDGGAAASYISAGDVNGDSFADLIVTGSSANSKAYVMLNNGNGTYGAAVSYAAGNGATSGILGDMNGDGFQDIVTGNFSAATVSVLLGNGNGTFNSATNYVVGSQVRQVDLADLNGDGVLDVVSTDSGSATASVFLGNTRNGAAPLLDFNLKTRADALQAIGVLDKKLSQLGQQRGTIGAYQSRLGHATENLSSLAENYAAAESRIRDADIAGESAKLINLQILQQATTAVLAQANQQSSLALQLLKLPTN